MASRRPEESASGDRDQTVPLDLRTVRPAVAHDGKKLHVNEIVLRLGNVPQSDDRYLE